MKKMIIAILMLACFGADAADSKMIVVDNLQCDNGMTANITDITTFKDGNAGDEVIANLHDADGNLIQSIDSHDDLIGFVELNDANKTAVRSLMLVGKQHDYYQINWSSDRNDHLDASIRIQFGRVVKCSLKEINSGI
jgi:hypothetical protein